MAHFDGAGAAAFSPELSRAGYLETDEEIAQDDDPLADIKAAWIMAGEDIKDFTVMKFNKKLREEEKRDFNKNFISGNTDYEEKIDLLNRMRRTSTSWAAWESTRASGTRRKCDVHTGRGRTSRATSSTPGSY